MKNKLFLATAILAFAACSENTYMGDQDVNTNGTGAISFGSGFKAVTRADKVGAEAASLLNKKFVVSGFKGNGTTMSTVFDNYIVNWTENTAGKTASNTSDWEYVGITAEAPSSLANQTYKTQTIKYWDYSASQYDFAAYSLGTNTSFTGEGELSAGYIKVTSIGKADTYAGPTYTLKGSAVDLAKCYISDMVTVNKADYNKEVQLSFRSLGTKIRVGFYETIPGYSVKDVKFYEDDATTSIETGASATSATLFMPSATSGFGSAGTYTVTFTNKVAQVAFAKDASASLVTLQTFGNLTYKAKEHNETAGNIYLGRSSNDVSFASTAGTEYNTVLPLSKTATGDVLELRVDYTLVPIDGADETITIHGAKAFVPATYTVWKPNYAYTYIFKISDNTNGWTSTVDTDPAGLFPITFDAVVTDATDPNNEQTTITTVATPSITTYQKGHNPSSNEYDKDKGAIYVQVMDNNANPAVLKADLDEKGQLYTLNVAKTEADVMDALNIQVPSTETTTITGRNGLVLTKAESSATITTIPGEDDNNITVVRGTAAEFTPAANTTYAYVYDTQEYTGEYYATAPTGWPTDYYTDAKCTEAATGDFAAGTFYKNTPTYIYTAETMTSVAPSDWTESDLWWEDPNGTNAVGTWETLNDGKIFYKRYTVNHKLYGVKVIKVVE